MISLLIVDNDQKRRRDIRLLAIESGFEDNEIFEAKTHEEAMRDIKETNFSVCVCDLHLTPQEQFEGLRVMKFLRQKCKDCTVIGITAAPDPSGYIGAAVLGPEVRAHDYVSLDWEPDRTDWRAVLKQRLIVWRCVQCRRFTTLLQRLKQLED